MGDFQNAVFGQKQALFSRPPSISAFMISIPWASDVNKYQILVPLIPLKVPKSILEVFKTLPEICSQHLILQSGPTVPHMKMALKYLSCRQSHSFLARSPCKTTGFLGLKQKGLKF